MQVWINQKGLSDEFRWDLEFLKTLCCVWLFKKRDREFTRIWNVVSLIDWYLSWTWIGASLGEHFKRFVSRIISIPGQSPARKNKIFVSCTSRNHFITNGYGCRATCRIYPGNLNICRSSTIHWYWFCVWRRDWGSYRRMDRQRRDGLVAFISIHAIHTAQNTSSLQSSKQEMKAFPISTYRIETVRG